MFKRCLPQHNIMSNRSCYIIAMDFLLALWPTARL
jgi:hypothetical protein